MGLLMGGTLAAKSVRHAFEVLAEIREAKGGREAENVKRKT